MEVEDEQQLPPRQRLLEHAALEAQAEPLAEPPLLGVHEPPEKLKPLEHALHTPVDAAHALQPVAVEEEQQLPPRHRPLEQAEFVEHVPPAATPTAPTQVPPESEPLAQPLQAPAGELHELQPVTAGAPQQIPLRHWPLAQAEEAEQTEPLDAPATAHAPPESV